MTRGVKEQAITEDSSEECQIKDCDSQTSTANIMHKTNGCEVTETILQTVLLVANAVVKKLVTEGGVGEALCMFLNSRSEVSYISEALAKRLSFMATDNSNVVYLMFFYLFQSMINRLSPFL